jgi:hypothetical protein
MPNNILYALGFFLTIGKRSGKSRNRTCTDKNRKARQNPNKTWLFGTRQTTDELPIQHLPQTLLSVKFGGAGGEEIVDKFSGVGLSRAIPSHLRGL